MSFTTYAPDTFISMPWKNGKGETIELLKEEIDNKNFFNWRLSRAQVSTDGDFSEFKAYERTLVLLSGNGITLDHQHSPQHVLTEPLQFAQFSGAERTTASLHDGPVIDFNIMTRKGTCSAAVTVSEYADNITLNNTFNLMLVYSVNAHVTIATQAEDLGILPAQHLLRVQKSQEEICLTGGPFIAVGINYD